MNTEKRTFLRCLAEYKVPQLIAEKLWRLAYISGKLGGKEEVSLGINAVADTMARVLEGIGKNERTAEG